MTPSTRFNARIYKQGILRCVDVPSAVAAAFAEWRYPPVVARVAGIQRATMLVPRAEGGFRLFLHDSLRRAAGADAGDTIEVELFPDEAPIERVPDDMLEAATRLDRGLEALELLPPGMRREMIRFVAGAKAPATRARRVVRIMELLAERVARLPD